ncbi:hypothetical protein FKM82_030142 [Ascaphus truei]
MPPNPPRPSPHPTPPTRTHGSFIHHHKTGPGSSFTQTVYSFNCHPTHPPTHPLLIIPPPHHTVFIHTHPYPTVCIPPTSFIPHPPTSSFNPPTTHGHSALHHPLSLQCTPHPHVLHRITVFIHSPPPLSLRFIHSFNPPRPLHHSFTPQRGTLSFHSSAQPAPPTVITSFELSFILPPTHPLSHSPHPYKPPTPPTGHSIHAKLILLVIPTPPVLHSPDHSQLALTPPVIHPSPTHSLVHPPGRVTILFFENIK